MKAVGIKVGLEIFKETSEVFLVAMIVERHSVQTSPLQVTWNAVKAGALLERGARRKEGRGVKHTIVLAAVRKVKETYNNLSVIMEKLQVTAMILFLVFPEVRFLPASLTTNLAGEQHRLQNSHGSEVLQPAPWSPVGYVQAPLCLLYVLLTLSSSLLPSLCLHYFCPPHFVLLTTIAPKERMAHSI